MVLQSSTTIGPTLGTPRAVVAAPNDGSGPAATAAPGATDDVADARYVIRPVPDGAGR
ncbi:hypothetical protein GCM10009613_18830 [Pseudonocardia kongjuensis]|uniref:Uncharacterized protein n=1 Tax=Pseudonocardia kongjuensis TaxID=102227 RepID=A0ABP4IEV9_9PSEU